MCSGGARVKLFLVGVVSGSASVAAAATLLSPGVGALASMVAGVMGWFVGEVLLFDQPSAWTWIEVFYFALGLVMLGLIVGRT